MRYFQAKISENRGLGGEYFVLRLAGAEPFPKRPSNFVCGLESLPVEFTPTSRLD